MASRQKNFFKVLLKDYLKSENKFLNLKNLIHKLGKFKFTSETCDNLINNQNSN